MPATGCCCYIQDLLELGLFFRKHPHAEVSILVWLEGGGHEQVLPWWHTEAIADLTQIDEGFRACFGRMIQEVFLVKVDVALALELGRHRDAAACSFDVYQCKHRTWRSNTD